MSQGFLYLLSEDDNDDIFYEGCLEKMTGKSFQLDPVRLLKGGGIHEVRQKLPVLLQRLRYSGPMDEVFFLVALDNDRSKKHPSHISSLDPGRLSKLPGQEQNKPCRCCELESVIVEQLGQRPWPVKGAIAVPVEMLESWALMICNPSRYPDEAGLPLFSEKSSRLAQRYFAPHPPEDQLKNLRETEKARLGITSSGEFYLHCAEQLDVEELAQRSPSFRLFKEWIEPWRV